MKDIHSDSKVLTLLPAAVYSADNTPAAIDLADFEAAEIVLSIGVGGITFSGVNKVEFVLTHSDDNVTYTNVTDNDVLGVTGVTNGIIKSLVAAHAAGATYRYGYRGDKRYIKLLADFSGTHGSGTPFAAAVFQARPHLKDVADQA